MLRTLEAAVRIAQERKRYGRPAAESDEVRQALGRLYAAARVNVLLGHYNASRAATGHASPGDAPSAKVLFSETNLALAELGMTLQGTSSILAEGDEGAISDGWWQDAFLYSRAYTIAGGTNEILQNLIAERALGLPKDPSPVGSSAAAEKLSRG
jgi:alkylation response protein AidB-like acyl-CoA dehydrogenase